jgi:N-acetylmuramic acid 6-phosphate etherase
MVNRQSTHLVLGLEGGATHSVALSADASGTEVRRVEAGPLNLRLLTDQSLLRQFRTFRGQLPEPGAICIGLAGLRTETDVARVLKSAAQVWPKVPCLACSDLEIALAAAELPIDPVGAQVLILSGTGSCCYGQTLRGRKVKMGGWGPLLGDKGSAYEIGLRALKACVYYYDRDRVWPEIGARILRALQLNEPDALIDWAQGAEKKDMAALALEVFAAWSKRDRIASDILAGAADSLAKDGIACARALVPEGTPVQFVFAGSVLLKEPRFARFVQERVRERWPKACMTPLQREGAWGAIKLAEQLWHDVIKSGAVLPLSFPRRLPDMRLRAVRSEIRLPEATGVSPTEQRHPKSFRLDKMPLREAIDLLLQEEGQVPLVLRQHTKKIEACVRLIVDALRQGGRLFYVGAGTSGRLGVLDASECPPTFRSPPDQVQGIMAGGAQALWRSIEGAEDDAAAGAGALRFRRIKKCDVVVGIAASGRTPFVWGALHEAKRVGARTILLCFNPHWRVDRQHRPTQVLALDLGPEILTGSTRLKAGTATKLLLNALTTLTMVRLGKVSSNLMVDLNPSNVKLRGRAVRIVCELAKVSEQEARRILEQSGWVVKRALDRMRA